MNNIFNKINNTNLIAEGEDAYIYQLDKQIIRINKVNTLRIFKEIDVHNKMNNIEGIIKCYDYQYDNKTKKNSNNNGKNG